MIKQPEKPKSACCGAEIIKQGRYGGKQFFEYCKKCRWRQDLLRPSKELARESEMAKCSVCHQPLYSFGEVEEPEPAHEECWKCGCRRETHPIPTCKEFVEAPLQFKPKSSEPAHGGKWWEKEFSKTMLITRAGAWLECSDYEGTVAEIKSFISKVEREAYERGKKESHPTVHGYCCACDYDIAGFKNELSEARAEAIEEVCANVDRILEGRNIEYPAAKELQEYLRKVSGKSPHSHLTDKTKHD